MASTESGSAVPAWPNSTASPPPQLPPPSLPPSSRGYPESSPRTNGVREVEGELAARRGPPSPLEQQHPAKKLRSASPIPLQHATQRRSLVDTSSVPRYGNAYSPPQRPVSRELVWEEDPYVVNRDATLHLAELYFSHINSSVFDLFPRATFMHWLSTCSDKTPEERMVLYAMLAVAARFADAVLADFGRHCGEVAAHAISSRHTHCSLLDVQARLLRCLYESAHGHDDAAWEMLGAAIRGATGKRLKLNLEKSCLADIDVSGAGRLSFRFGSEQLAECNRRTFWACFLMDRFSGGSHCAISYQNVFVRLPCSDEVYERGRPSDAPLFSDSAANTISSSPTSGRMSAMAWLILFASVWGDVLDFLHRAPHRPESTYRDEYDDFYQRTYNELQHLVSRLPEHLRYDAKNPNNHANIVNLERSLREGYAAWFVTMHALYHFVLIRLNRRMRHHLMLDKVARNIQQAHSEA
ncbi:MAG: fungal specific transcription factor domain-containing protein, partial [Terriglobus roseus]|nr:fungal specific transcription factor domain-containing protein [Terriglobus roseus]